MIVLEEVMEIAENFISRVSGQIQDFHLEEAYLDDNRNVWKVTCSFFQKNDASNALQRAAGIQGRRVYRTLEIDNDKKQILGMKAGFGSNLGETV
jgi:hypothetical protein